MVTEIGEKITDVALTSLDGDEVSLSDYLGTRLILFCWASW
jgi:peroxiredoxin